MNKKFNKTLPKKMDNNFVTCPFDHPSLKRNDKIQTDHTEKAFSKKHKEINENESKIYLQKMCSNEKLRHQEVRRYREMMELKQSEEKWKN